jgi:hypothetical protein
MHLCCNTFCAIQSVHTLKTDMCWCTIILCSTASSRLWPFVFFQKNLISVVWQAIAVKSFRCAQGHDVVLVNLSRQQKGLRASKTWQLCNFNFENLLGKIRMVQLWMKTEQQASTWAKQHLAAISLKRHVQRKYFWSTIEKQIVEARQKPATCLNSTHTSAD